MPDQPVIPTRRVRPGSGVISIFAFTHVLVALTLSVGAGGTRTGNPSPVARCNVFPLTTTSVEALTEDNDVAQIVPGQRQVVTQPVGRGVDRDVRRFDGVEGEEIGRDPVTLQEAPSVGVRASLSMSSPDVTKGPDA